MENATVEQPGRQPKLTRLEIESFRHGAPCEVRFSNGLDVLLGQNATGKTTLLEMIGAWIADRLGAPWMSA